LSHVWNGGKPTQTAAAKRWSVTLRMLSDSRQWSWWLSSGNDDGVDAARQRFKGAVQELDPFWQLLRLVIASLRRFTEKRNRDEGFRLLAT